MSKKPSVIEAKIPEDAPIMQAWRAYCDKYKINQLSPIIGETWWAFHCGWCYAGGEMPKGFARDHV